MRPLVLLFFLLSNLTGYSQHRFNKVNECLEFARTNNFQLKNEKLNHQLAEQRVKSAWALLLPQLKAVGSLDDNVSLPVQLIPAQFVGGAEGDYAKLRFGTQYTASFGAEASLSLLNVSNFKNVKATQLQQEVAQQQLNDKDLQLSEQIVAAYYFSLLSRTVVSLANDFKNANDSLLQTANVRLAQGILEILDYNRIKALNIESSNQLKESEGVYQKNIDALKVLLGIQNQDSIILTEYVENISVQHNSLIAQPDQLPSFKAFAYKHLQTKEELLRQRAKILPELSLYARYSRQAFRNEFNFFSSGNPWFDVGMVGLKAEWNLFTGFNRQSTICQASLQATIAQQELEGYKMRLAKELDELNVNHQVAFYGLQNYQEHYQLNKKNYRIAAKKYTEGVFTLDQFITIHQELVRSRNQYVNQLANYLVYNSVINLKNEYQVK